MAQKLKLYCPEWLYEVAVGQTIFEFITKEFSLDMIAKKYGEGLSNHYIEIPYQEISKPAEDIIRFMAEIKGTEFEAHERANHFVHYRLKYDGLKGKRKLKGLFGSAFEPTKDKAYNETKVVKDFKAFTFSLRSGTVPSAASGWALKNEQGLEFFGEIINQDFSLDDLL